MIVRRAAILESIDLKHKMSLIIRNSQNIKRKNIKNV